MKRNSYITIATAFLVVIIVLLNFGSACNKLCMRPTLNSNYFSAQLTLYGTPLDNQDIFVSVNNAYTSLIVANKTGYISFYGPFNFGSNIVMVRYGAFKQTSQVYYLGDYSGLIYLLLGIFGYVILKLISDVRSANRSIFLSVGAGKNATVEFGIEKEQLDGAIRALKKRNDSRNITKELPVTVQELREELLRMNNVVKKLDGSMLDAEIMHAVGQNAADSNLRVFGNLIVDSGKVDLEVISKHLYERAVAEGDYTAYPDKSEMISKNGVISIKQLHDSKQINGKARVVALDHRQAGLFREMISSYSSKSGALLYLWCTDTLGCKHVSDI